MSRYVLDACALIALLQEEPGADKVAAAYSHLRKLAKDLLPLAVVWTSC